MARGVVVGSTRAGSLGGVPTSCYIESCRVTSIVLVDARGWVLLQERDEHAPVAPNQWGLLGGHLEGEETHEQAIRRELLEETGLPDAPGLTVFFDRQTQHAAKARADILDHWVVWLAPAGGVTDADIVLGEGRQIVFVDPDEVLGGGMDVHDTTERVLREVIGSSLYREIVAAQ